MNNFYQFEIWKRLRHIRGGTLLQVTIILILCLISNLTFANHTDWKIDGSGDFSNIDFAAAEPSTYDHSIGGGMYGDGSNTNVVETLNGGDFSCGDLVSYFVALEYDGSGTTDDPETVELDFKFLCDATGQSGIAYDQIVNVAVNTGDAGMIDDGGSVATLESSMKVGTIFQPGCELLGTIKVTDIEDGETIIIRIDVSIACDLSLAPTGVLQGSLMASRIVENAAGLVTPPVAIPGGAQTINLKSVNKVGGTCEVQVTCPAAAIELTAASGTCSAVMASDPASASCGLTGTYFFGGDTYSSLIGVTFPVGTTIVTFKAENGDESDECTFDIKVSDNEKPMVICKDPLLMPSFALDVNCELEITPDDIDNGSNDNCTEEVNLIRSVSPSTFNAPGMYEVTLTVKDESGNEDFCKLTIRVVDNMPPSITCKDHTVSLVDGVASIVPADVYSAANDNCGPTTVTLDKYDFSCADVGANTVKVTIEDGAGQSVSCNATVTVVNNSAPVIKCNFEPIFVYIDEDGMDTITQDQALLSIGATCGDVAVTIERTIFTCEDAGADLTLKVTVKDLTNNSVNECNILVKVRDELDPEIECKDPLTVFLSHVDADGQIKLNPQDLLKSYSDNCGIDWDNSYVDPAYVDCSDAETNVTATVYVVDFSGNKVECDVNIFVDDNVSPTLSCFDPHPHRTFSLDADGKLTLTLADLHGGDPSTLFDFSDNCVAAPSSIVIDPVTFNCDDLGEQTVTITAYDGNGNKATCDITVNVVDNLLPTVECLATPVERVLNETISEIKITYEDLIFIDPDHPDNLVTDFINDNCGVKDIKIARDTTTPDKLVFVDMVSFNCEDIGYNKVIIKVWDESDNMTTCDAVVVIKDEAAPHAFCVTPLVLPLVVDETTGEACVIIKAEDIAYDVEDNCGVEYIKITKEGTTTLDDQIKFDCYDIAFDADGLAIPILITLTVEDKNGNIATCETTVTIEDNIKPTLECPEGIMSVDLDADGNGIISTEMVRDFILNNGGSFEDECGIESYEVDQENYTCGNVGAHVITFTVKDPSGNEASCEIDIWVQDNTSPVVACKPNDSFHPLPFTLSNGSLTLVPGDILKSATDNCDVTGLSIAPNKFDCSHIGEVQIVTLTAFDVEGNTGTCTALILIESSAAPKAACRDVELILDADGNAELTVNMVNNGSEGDCETTLSFAPDALVETLPYDCSHVTFDTDGNLETHEVTLYVTDGAGNQESCKATITVKDVTAPIAKCRAVPLDLPLTDGHALVPISNINAGSYDGCGGPLKLSVDPAAFDCSHVGTPQTVTLTVEDESGNKSTCEAIINVVNNQAPSLECKDAVVALALDAAGMRTLEVTDLLAENSVPCATGVVYEIIVAGRDDAKFSCDDINFEDLGAPYIFDVTLKATANGHTVECQTQVEIVDEMDPEIDCAADVVTLELDAWGKVDITALNLPFTASDNCGLKDTIISPNLFYCEHTEDGEIDITITVIDSSGNEATCVRKVIIEDNTAPTITCPDDITLEPDGDCKATHTWTIPIPEDYCGIAEIFVDPPNFVTVSDDGLTASADFPTGTTLVTYRAEDHSGNSEFCVFRVTVTDTQAPDFVNCPTGDVVVITDPGKCSKDISLSDDLKIGVSDNCDLVSYTCKYTYPDLSEEEVDALIGGDGHSAFPKGRTRVLLTAVDAFGNKSICEFDVWVSDDEAPTIAFNDSYPALQGLTDGDMVEIPLADLDQIGAWNADISDNCPGVNIQFLDQEIRGDECASGGYLKTLECTWTATDASNNVTEVKITIKVLCPVANPDLFVAKNPINPSFSLGDSRTLIISLNEINSGATAGQMRILVGKSSGFEYDFDGTQSLSGSTAVNNSDWELQNFPAFLVFVSKPGVVIPADGKSRIALGVTAKTAGTVTNLQAKLESGAGGDINATNNIANLSFSIQRTE